MKSYFKVCCVTTLVSFAPAFCAEKDALAIEATIEARHLPYGAILDPVLSLPDLSQVVSYTRCGDSALWTGHYLAAEAYRYKVTGSPEALNNINKHADATHAEIRFRRRDSRVDLRITDDGRGFDSSSTPPGHFGLSIMRERAKGLGATLRLESRPGAGTRIDVHWRGVLAGGDRRAEPPVAGAARGASA